MTVDVSDHKLARGLPKAHAAPRRLGPLVAVGLILALSAARTTRRKAIISIEPIAPAAATDLEFATLPDSGPPLARRTVLYRRLVAPLNGADGLRGVPGVGTRRLHAWSRWMHTR